MEEYLLDIWGENGASLRFGDAKNGFLCGASFAAVTSYVQGAFAPEAAGWSVMEHIAFPEITGGQSLAMGLMCLAFFTSLLSIVPSRSRASMRVRLILTVGRFLHLSRRRPGDVQVLYFMDVAAFRSETDYQAQLWETLSRETKWTAAEQNLIQQIWVVSRIAASKYILFYLAFGFLILGAIIAILQGAGHA